MTRTLDTTEDTKYKRIEESQPSDHRIFGISDPTPDDCYGKRYDGVAEACNGIPGDSLNKPCLVRTSCKKLSKKNQK